MTDTIIEIAAIRFEIEKTDTGNFHVINQTEKSMLIDPEREMTEEISLITHITDDMLIGKPRWRDIQEKVADFIGDSTIVGHNVLFDVAMLAAHGLNLTEHNILDTFELSELFS